MRSGNWNISVGYGMYIMPTPGGRRNPSGSSLECDPPKSGFLAFTPSEILSGSLGAGPDGCRRNPSPPPSLNRDPRRGRGRRLLAEAEGSDNAATNAAVANREIIRYVTLAILPLPIAGSKGRI